MGVGEQVTRTKEGTVAMSPGFCMDMFHNYIIHLKLK